MKRYFNIIAFVLMTLPLLGQVRLERDYNRSFSVPEDAKVEVVSKYGEIIIRTWDLDSVRFDVVVRAEGRNSSAVAKSMARVDVKFKKVGSVISAITEISSGNGFFGSVVSEVGGAMGANKLKIDYEVFLPKEVLLSVENKYGDVYLTSIDNKVDLNVSHGDIKANDINGSLNLKHSFGKSSFGVIQEGIFTLRGSETTVDRAIALNVESGSSELRIDEISNIQLNSRNDKIHLVEVEEVICEGSFTNLTADLLKGSARLDFSYGDIYLGRIVKDFDAIDITGKSTDINLILNQASYIKTFIKGPEDRMILPNSMLTMQKDIFADQEKISLSGFVGNTNTRHSRLNINADGGELIVAIKETPFFVDKD
ncbi:MAG: hypothetical protein HRT61_05630 [Ekhidna sp.]|nr:hypothetical protein [Ekhidna sp.]